METTPTAPPATLDELTEPQQRLLARVARATSEGLVPAWDLGAAPDLRRFGLVRVVNPRGRGERLVATDAGLALVRAAERPVEVDDLSNPQRSLLADIAAYDQERGMPRLHATPAADIEIGGLREAGLVELHRAGPVGGDYYRLLPAGRAMLAAWRAAQRSADEPVGDLIIDGDGTTITAEQQTVLQDIIDAGPGGRAITSGDVSALQPLVDLGLVTVSLISMRVAATPKAVELLGVSVDPEVLARESIARLSPEEREGVQPVEDVVAALSSGAPTPSTGLRVVELPALVEARRSNDDAVFEQLPVDGSWQVFHPGDIRRSSLDRLAAAGRVEVVSLVASIGRLSARRLVARDGEHAPCPDGGRCHHDCRGRCFRVVACAPLSGVYADDRWPAGVRAEFGASVFAGGPANVAAACQAWQDVLQQPADGSDDEPEAPTQLAVTLTPLQLAVILDAVWQGDTYGEVEHADQEISFACGGATHIERAEALTAAHDALVGALRLQSRVEVGLAR